MPCLDPSTNNRDDIKRRFRKKKRSEGHLSYEPSVRELESILCGLLSTMNKVQYEYVTSKLVDWQEVGLPKEFLDDWWEDHLKKDAARKYGDSLRRNRL